MNPSNYLWLTAGVAGVTAAWNQIKSMFGRFISYFFVTATLDGNVTPILMSWLWANAKPSPFGSHMYTAYHSFMRPKERYGIVTFRTMGSASTFFLGWIPIFISYNRQEQNALTTVSYFRATLDLEALLVKATDVWNDSIRVVGDQRSRYRISRIMGKKKAQNVYGNDGMETKSSAPLAQGQDIRSTIPLGFTPEELVAPTQKNPFSMLFYSPEVDNFIAQIENWFKSEEWYRERSIPWRFGGSLFGPPGTGKTSLARAIAQLLDIPIMIVDLTTMDNNDLVEAWAKISQSAPCLILLEDLDRVYDVNAEARAQASDLPHQQVGPTLDCLLNCISGVEPANGILVLATANDITKLDPALGVPDATGKSTRPGRLDVGVYLGILDQKGREAIALRILPTKSQDLKTVYDPKDYVDELVAAGDGETGAQFTKRCADKALELYWRKTS